MKVALDTSLIVRLIVDDDTAQVDQVERLLEKADEVFIASITLCEVVWVLRRTYKMSTTTVVTALRRIAAIRSVTIDRQAFEAGLDMFEAGGDFADGCILFEAKRAKCDRLATLDQTFVALGGSFVAHPRGSNA